MAEPTEFQTVVAHKGVVRWRIRTSGRACHSSAPDQGDNAVYRMARVLLALEEYAKSVVGELGDDQSGPRREARGDVLARRFRNLDPVEHAGRIVALEADRHPVRLPGL